MTYRLDIVSIRVENIRCVVVGIVVQTRAGEAVVGASSGQCRGVERVDDLPFTAGEGDVDTG